MKDDRAPHPSWFTSQTPEYYPDRFLLNKTRQWEGALLDSGGLHVPTHQCIGQSEINHTPLTSDHSSVLVATYE